jgi:hypothetical protein
MGFADLVSPVEQTLPTMGARIEPRSFTHGNEMHLAMCFGALSGRGRDRNFTVASFAVPAIDADHTGPHRQAAHIVKRRTMYRSPGLQEELRVSASGRGTQRAG